MTKLKPVWRMNKGLGVPSDLGDKILLKGETSQAPEWMLEWHQPWRLDMELPVTAYQTNRTKSAKYERVKCDECRGCGNELEYDQETGGLYVINLMCKKCNGTGRIARRITC